jgi:predicted metallo-beta-lactamase superfamily hydrolase
MLFDAGVSLCPFRFCLPPHPVEFATIDKLRKRIADGAKKAQVITISHYHFDHHTPSHEDWLVNWTLSDETARQIYSDKIVLMKNSKIDINDSQRQRALMFEKTAGKYARRLEVADGQTFRFGSETQINFSKAVSHGSSNSRLGWVIMATVEYGTERFVFAPDVQGPMVSHTAELIKMQNPQLAMVGGPPFHLRGTKVDEVQLNNAVDNLISIVKVVPTIILDHHLLRDPDWHTHTASIYAAASQFGHKVMTAAEYCGVENQFLEFNRAQLYAKYPVSKDFQNWMNLTGQEQSQIQPPI